MNREKYVKDKSYREGYLDGCREGRISVITLCETFFSKLFDDSTTFQNRLLEMLKEAERSEENGNDD